jgi:hypothetical protein
MLSGNLPPPDASRSLCKRGALPLLVSSLAFLALACQRTLAPSGDPMRPEREEDRLFQKKLDCGKMLAEIEGSALGPKPHPAKGTLPTNPVVIYSPTLNTCVLVSGAIISGRTDVRPIRSYRTRYVDADDLLTGQSLEHKEFDLLAPEQAKAAQVYEDEVVRRYEAQVGTTLTPEQQKQLDQINRELGVK